MFNPVWIHYLSIPYHILSSFGQTPEPLGIPDELLFATPIEARGTALIKPNEFVSFQFRAYTYSQSRWR
jgi:hypothetical protein